jgi:hypothetical protein
MNQILQRSFFIAALFATTVAVADVIPYLDPRSQGINGARELVGWQSQINKWDMCTMYGSFSITPEFTKTFKSNRITEALFSDALTTVTTSNGCNTGCHNNCNTSCHNNCNTSCHNSCNTGCNTHCNSCDNSCGDTILIQGTEVLNRDAQALMAENFYLPTDYSSQITFHPTVENFLVDFNYYQGLDEWVEGMYFRIHTPVTWTRWNLNYCENVINPGVNNMDPGYFNDTYTPPDDSGSTGVYGLARNQLLGSFEEFISGGNSITGVEGITYDPLCKAKWNPCRMTKTALAEITAAWGWNFVRCENFLFGLNIRAAAPTGNRPHGTYIFEPIVGNGKHWELGGGLNSWWTWWRSCDEDRNFTVYLDAYATHMFKTRQCRTFDLCGKPLSRYMLAMKFQAPVADLYAGAGDTAVAPSAQFANEFTPVANLTTIPVDVSYAVQGEVILKFAYTHCNFQWDLGYDFWGRSCAKIKQRCDCGESAFADGVWGLKGDAFAFGFVGTDTTIGIGSPATPLSATESAATIFSGTNNYPDGLNGQTWNQNPGIDNPQIAWDSADVVNALSTHMNDNNDQIPSAIWPQVNTSLDPVLLTEADIDVCSARTRGISNKIFTHFGYIWKEHECWTPYLGIGGEVEFGSGGKCSNNNCHTPCATTCTSINSCNNHCNTNCNNHCNTSCHNCCDNGNESCQKFAFSQWGVWVKGGFSFN